MRMTRTDKVMAIMRHPEFLKDYQEYLALTGRDQEVMFNTLYKKWKENITLVYVHYLNYERWKSEGQITGVYDYGIALQGKPSDDHSEGRYLYLRVDLTRTATSLRKEFVNLLQTMERLGVKQKTKERVERTDYDPWEIYDLCHQQGLNVNQIAKQKAGIDENPTYNEAVMNYYKRIDYALKKAEKMMMALDKQVAGKQ